MSTEVKHGPIPTFEHETSGTPYGLTIVSHQTTTPDVAAGGVTEHQYSSVRPEKRRAELLNLRTIFLHWWLHEWMTQGGDLGEGAAQLAGGAADTAVKIESEQA